MRIVLLTNQQTNFVEIWDFLEVSKAKEPWQANFVRGRAKKEKAPTPSELFLCEEAFNLRNLHQ